jgi:hypothetical protein
LTMKLSHEDELTQEKVISHIEKIKVECLEIVEKSEKVDESKYSKFKLNHISVV